eukprot:2800805-Alexandrium_andersonii.AAC.1
MAPGDFSSAHWMGFRGRAVRLSGAARRLEATFTLAGRRGQAPQAFGKAEPDGIDHSFGLQGSKTKWPLTRCDLREGRSGVSVCHKLPDPCPTKSCS